jgi:DNA repair exonuclease SbcCD ATPase subunit
MEPLDITHEDDAGADIPEAPHVEIMFDALNDTVTGTEGMTPAQHYAAGVLSANGYRPATSVAGTEGFFGSVASGAKAVYDYIIKMFKSVWGFFFNRDGAAQAEAAKKEAKDSEQHFKDAVVSPSSEEAVNEALKKVSSTAAKLEDIPTGDQAALDKFMTEGKEALKSGTVAEKKAALKNLVNEMPKVNKKGQYSLKHTVENVVDLNKKFIALCQGADTKINGNIDADVTKLVHAIVGDVAKYLGHASKTVADLEKHTEIKSVAEAQAIHAQVQAEIAANKALVDTVKSHTSSLNNEIKFYESLAKEDAKGTHTSGHLTVLRGILTFSTNVAQYLKRSMKAQVVLSKTVNSVFGL